MAAVMCTCMMFSGSPLTTMVVVSAVGEFGLLEVSLEGVVMTTLWPPMFIGCVIRYCLEVSEASVTSAVSCSLVHLEIPTNSRFVPERYPSWVSSPRSWREV